MNNRHINRLISTKSAFTLAEVLITLAIIGVVAAMVVPALLNNSNNKETVVRIKKIYSILSSAHKMMEANGVDFDSLYSGNMQHNNILNAFAPHLAISQKCGTTSGLGCFPVGVRYKYLDGSNGTIEDNNPNHARAVLNDGTLIEFGDDAAGGCTVNFDASPTAEYCGGVLIDINGFAGPNQLGRDFFQFYIARSGVYPRGRFMNTFECDASSADTITKQGWGCARKILQEDAVNY